MPLPAFPNQIFQARKVNEMHRDEAVPFSSDEHRVERAKETRRRREKKKGGGFKLGIEGEESWSSFEKKGVLKGGRKKEGRRARVGIF